MRDDWTKEQDLYVINNYYAIPATAIADYVGRTKNAVIGRAKRLGIANNDNYRAPYLAEYLVGQGKHQLLLREDAKV